MRIMRAENTLSNLDNIFSMEFDLGDPSLSALQMTWEITELWKRMVYYSVAHSKEF